jgi:hypothetical protein
VLRTPLAAAARGCALYGSVQPRVAPPTVLRDHVADSLGEDVDVMSDLPKLRNRIPAVAGVGARGVAAT